MRKKKKTIFTPYQQKRYDELKTKAKEQVLKETSMKKFGELFNKFTKAVDKGIKKDKFTKDAVENFNMWKDFYFELFNVFVVDDKEHITEIDDKGTTHTVVDSIRPVDKGKIDYDYLQESLTEKTYKAFKEREKLIPKDSNNPYAYDLLDVFCEVVSE